MNIEDTIDAFLDGERVAPSALEAALAAAEGRAYLIDVLALRELVSDAPAEAVAPARRGPARLVYARAAVVALGLLGLGYAAGATRAAPPESAAMETNAARRIAAPEPTRVIELTPGVNWHESKGGD
jgi:hypothetical protein